VTLWVSDSVREEIEAMAKKNCELTLSKRPRTGVIVTALVTLALEHLHEEPTK
jgi:hypothetical protein